MAHAVAVGCRQYFTGFYDVSACNNKERTCGSMMLGILKIISYITVILPLFFGLLYGISSLFSLCCRATKLEDLPFDERTKKLFECTELTRQLFKIKVNGKDTEVGVIFNPTRNMDLTQTETVAGNARWTTSVVVVSEDTPEGKAAADQVICKIPAALTHQHYVKGHPIPGMQGYDLTALQYYRFHKSPITFTRT